MEYTEMEALRRRSKRIWNYLGLALIIAGVNGPIGICLLLANMLGLLPAMGKVAGRSSHNDPSGKDPGESASQTGAKMPLRKKWVCALPEPRAWLKALIVLLGAFLTYACTGFGLILLLIFAITQNSTHLFLLLLCVGGSIGGVWMMNSGRLSRKKRARFEIYLKLIGDRQTLPIQYLADQMGLDYEQVVKDLREMVHRGLLPPYWLK